jgi:hypothetical protein
MFFLLFLFAIFNINNVYSINDKFCVNCRHFVKPGLFCDEKYGRCRLYPKKTDMGNELNYLVSGKRKLEYRFCNFVREDETSCGASGKYYTEKIFIFPGKKFIQNKLCLIKNQFEVIDNNNEQLEEEQKNIITVEE